MDCCSSSNYMDYRHHSMNSNFCYPYAPSMLRSASPYPLAGPGAPGSSRYATADYRSAALGYPGAAMGYDGYDKYYGGYHHPAASGYPSGYYGNYSSSSYREYGGYGHYYHQSQSPYARGSAALAGAPSYAGGSPAGGYLYPGGRHYPSSSSLGHPFGRESYYHAQHREHHQQQYSSFASYGGLSAYSRNGVGPAAPDHPSNAGKPQHHQQQQPYPVHQSYTAAHTDRGSAELNGDGPSPPSASLFNAPNGYSPSPDYPLSSSYASADSPQHPPGSGHHDAGGGGSVPDDGGGDQPPTSETPAPSQSAMLSATGEFPPATKDTRMRKPKERKLHRAYGSGGSGSGCGSRNSSPGAGNGLSGNGAATRMKSLDALTNLCWPEGEQFPTRMRKYSNANGLKSKDGSNGRKEINELDSSPSTASPSRGASGPGRRTKKQTGGGKQSAKEAKTAADGRENQPNRGVMSTAPVENKNVTPLPGFQQAFGSTEIGKFSEVFFNSSPSPADLSPSQHHPMLHQQQQQQHQQQEQQDQQDQQGRQQPQGRGNVRRLVMDTLNAYESDVDTLSPQPWDAAGAGPGDPYEGPPGTGYNLQIGTSFHPAYYESSSYSDHAVDSPLGNYFSEMTCNEFVN